MRMVDIIQKKRDGYTLTKEEISFVINGCTTSTVPDYQLSAFAMATYFQGMNRAEVSNLTMSMVHSGESIDLKRIDGIKVDKHSTGGVGDKISFVVGPLVASLGIPVAKMSGRGLGHTGGTIDKLESIPGFKVELSREEFIRQVNDYKLAIVGQSGNLTPADKKLYGLRDVTATVDSIPLIASSIMSKKIASGADAIVLDVKTGSGAFMKTLDGARELAKTMVEIGNSLKKRTVAIISDMSEPLGYEIGNATELMEAIQVLRGENIKDVREIALRIASHMAVLADKFSSEELAYKQLEQQLINGKALSTFRNFIAAQGGDPSIVDDFNQFPKPSFYFEIKAEQSGYIKGIEADKIGTAAMLLGAGRKKKEDEIDHSVGITLKKKTGDSIKAGETIAGIQSNHSNPTETIQLIKDAYTYSVEKVPVKTLIHDIIT